VTLSNSKNDLMLQLLISSHPVVEHAAVHTLKLYMPFTFVFTSLCVRANSRTSFSTVSMEWFEKWHKLLVISFDTVSFRILF